jgi:hypothetical protein
MAIGELALDLPAPVAADIAASQGEGRWSVDRSGWKKVLPDLPDEVIALLATPVVVCVDSLAAAVVTPRTGPDGAEDLDDRHPAPHDPCASREPAGAGCTPRFLAPAPPRSRRARRRI